MAATILDGFDLDTLLSAFGDDAPAGTDLRENFSPDSPYFRLRDARAEARDAERQSESVDADTIAPTQWRAVQSLAIEALGRHSKDLEIASWLMEALVRTGGLLGLATGAALIEGLIDRFWDGLFPMPDEDGMETRVGPVAGLSGQGYDGTLLQPLRRVTLFRRPDGSGFGMWQFEASAELAGISDSERRSQRIEAGTVPIDTVEKEARAAGSAHWGRMRTEVANAAEAWAAMTASLDAHAGGDSPSTGRVRDLLGEMLETCTRFAPVEAAAPSEAETDPGSVEAVSQSAGETASGPPGRITTREQALRQLGEIAEWFKRNEPHSPIAYTIDEAARRGRMMWPELIAELLPDESSRQALLVALGIKPVVSEE